MVEQLSSNLVTVLSNVVKFNPQKFEAITQRQDKLCLSKFEKLRACIRSFFAHMYVCIVLCTVNKKNGLFGFHCINYPHYIYMQHFSHFQCKVPCGLVVRIQHSHRRGRGLIHCMGSCFFIFILSTDFCCVCTIRE